MAEPDSIGPGRPSSVRRVWEPIMPKRGDRALPPLPCRGQLSVSAANLGLAAA